MVIREASLTDLKAIMNIYNEGIEDRVATLETETKDLDYMEEWLKNHSERYKVLVAEENDEIFGWASLNPYNSRCAYAGVADLSVYIARKVRGKGIGSRLLTALDDVARENGFHKIVLFTFPFNKSGQRLYQKQGYRQVGIFKNQGVLEGKFVDVMAMEKLLE